MFDMRNRTDRRQVLSVLGIILTCSSIPGLLVVCSENPGVMVPSILEGIILYFGLLRERNIRAAEQEE